MTFCKTVRLFFLYSALGALGLLWAPWATASIIAVAGPNSSAGTAPAIIAAPSQVLDSAVFNTGMEGFDELQGALLIAPITTDQGVIPAGTRVDSHMIFLNKEDGVSGTLTHAGVTWTFSGLILGTMSDTPGLLEEASSAVLGAPGTVYPAAFANRGLEGNDSLTIFGNQLQVGVSMLVTQPGDWIRVVTQAVPEPGSLWLLGLGLAGLGLARRRLNA